MEQGVFESDRIAVAPLSELLSVGEEHGLHRSQPSAWDILALDIETSIDALNEESHLASMSLGTQ